MDTPNSPQTMTGVDLKMDNVIMALCVLSGYNSSTGGYNDITPVMIKEAETALLSWENTNPNEFSSCLLSVIYYYNHCQPENKQIPRLAALLTLKAMVKRRWKDRGRRNQKKGFILLSEEIKTQIRNAVLSFVTIGTLDLNHGSSRDLSSVLLNDRPLQAAAASLLSLIGSMDLPLQFGNLIPTLVECSIGSQVVEPIFADITRLNASNALEMTLEGICSKRLLVYKKYVITVSRNHLDALVSNGFALSMGFLRDLGAKHTDMALEYAIIMTQIVHHLISSSLTAIADETKLKVERTTMAPPSALASIDQVFTLVYECLPTLMTHTHKMREQAKDGSMLDNIESQLQSLLAKLCQLITYTQSKHPVPFVRYLDPFLNLFYDDLTHAVSNVKSLSAITLSILEMSFLANVISCSEYKPEPNSNEAILTYNSEMQKNGVRTAITANGDANIDISDVQNVVHNVWGVFLNHQRISILIDTAFFFMTLNTDHLQEWSADPESFYIARSNSVADDDVLACAQNLYLSLCEAESSQETIVKKVVSIMENTEAQMAAIRIEAGNIIDNSSSTGFVGGQSVLQWDTIYTAVGLSLSIIEKRSQLNLKAWLECVVRYLKIITGRKNIHCTTLPILRHRIIWLIGCSYQYIGDRKYTAEVLVSILTNVSDTQNDTAVQLAAVQALNNILCDPDDSLICSLHHPDHIISSLYVLTNGCEDVESQSQSLSCVSLLLSCIVGVGNTIGSSTAEAIVIPLSQIWEETQVHNTLLRRDVLSILSSVATAVEKEQFGALSLITLPLLNNVLDPSAQEENIFLIETSLILWLTLLRLAGSYDSNLAVLFIRVKEILMKDLEHVKILTNIVQGYILLGGAAFLSQHSITLQQILALLVGNVNPRGVVYVNLIFESLLGAFPSQGVPLFIHGGIVKTIIYSCAANYYDESECEPDQVIIIYLSVLARLILQSSSVLDNFLPVCSKQGNAFDHDHLLSLYFRFFQSDEPSILRQKLWTTFFLSLLPPSSTSNGFTVHLLDLMDSFMSCCLSTVRQSTMPLVAFSVGYDSEEETIEVSKDRYNALLEANLRMDTIHNIDIRSNVKTKIQKLAADLGKNDYDRLLHLVRPNVLRELEQIIG